MEAKADRIVGPLKPLECLHQVCNSPVSQNHILAGVRRDLGIIQSSPLLEQMDLIQVGLNISRGGDCTASLFQCSVTLTEKFIPFLQRAFIPFMSFQRLHVFLLHPVIDL